MYGESDDLVEEESGNENVKNEVPFNPQDISINIIPRTIGQIVDMIDFDEIVIPPYQRLPNLWNSRKKSRFIESLMLNLPIPLFYFDEGADKKWRIIDGLQRISTLEQFILGGRRQVGKAFVNSDRPFILEDLEFRGEFNGSTWGDLPRQVQRRILTNQVTINLIGKETPDVVKYNIFSRINQGSVELKAQEIRSAIFQGYAIDFVESLVASNTEEGRIFLQATDNSIPKQRQQDLDFATRFVSFYYVGYEKYEPDMDNFLNRGMESIPKKIEEQNEIRSNFYKAMKFSLDLFGKDAFRKKVNVDRRQPVNKSLFEVVSVHFAKCSSEKLNSIERKKEYFKKEFYKLLSDTEFVNSITLATATREKVRQRHSSFEKLITDFGND